MRMIKAKGKEASVMSETAAAPRRTKKTKKKKSVGRIIWGFFKGLFLTLFTLIVIGVLTTGLFYRTFMKYVDTVLEPEMEVDITALTLKQSSAVYYQDKTTGSWVELTKLHGTENRTLVSYDQIPDHVVKALIAVEDKRFYEHDGVDWYGTAGQMVNMLRGKDVRGASTITQQVIKNVTGNNQVTIRRKVLEIFQALRAHENYSNEEILETYFNLVYYGDGAYGIEAAAETYFGKTVEELDVAEGACIIGITQYPYMYDPSRGEKYRTANKTRQEWVLKKMWEQEFLTEAEYEAAKAEKLVFVWDSDYVEDAEESADAKNVELDSFFVEQVYRDVVAAFVEQGYSERVASQMVYNGGYQIYCTMDPELQDIIESVYADVSNFNYPSSDGQQLQSGMTIIDNATGNIVAIAGRVGERKGALELSFATSSSQCGSAIKPLSVYGPALDAGVITAASVIDDYPVMELSGTAWPVNAYKGYSGIITLQEALRISSNTCAVRTLQQLTPAASYAFMTEKLGFTTLDNDDLTAAGALALGGLHKGVSTVQMAAAYATFANNGVYIEPRTFVKVTDSSGNVVIDNTQDSWVAMKESTVYTMNEMLKNVMKRGTGTSAAFSGMTQAGKTGTTNSKRDRYFCGYTPYYTAAVWCGYGQPARIDTTDNPSALVWKKVMQRVHEGLENRDFPTTANGMSRVTVCNKTGLLAGAGCTSTRTVYVANGTAPSYVCDGHVGIEFCVESGLPVNEFCPTEEGMREMHSVLDFSKPNVAAGWGYSRELLYRGMSNEQYAVYAAQVEAGLRESIPTKAPIRANDSDSVMTDIMEMGICVTHLTPPEPEEPPIDPNDPENPLDPNWFAPPENPENPENPGGEEPGEDPENPDDPNEQTEEEYRDELLGLDNPP